MKEVKNHTQTEQVNPLGKRKKNRAAPGTFFSNRDARGNTRSAQAQDEDSLTWNRWRSWDKALLAAMDRLRASQEKCSQVAHETGCLFGTRWAEQADAAELRLLANLRDKHDSGLEPGWEQFFEKQEDEEQADTAYGVCDALYGAIHPEHDGDRDQADEFWGGVIGRILRDAACPDVLLKGFAEGALEIWDKNPR